MNNRQEKRRSWVIEIPSKALAFVIQTRVSDHTRHAR